MGDTGLHMLVNVLGRKALRYHHDLQVIDELRHLNLSRFVRFVFARHPHFGGFLNDFFADAVDSPVELLNSTGPLRAFVLSALDNRIKVFKVIHAYRLCNGRSFPKYLYDWINKRICPTRIPRIALDLLCRGGLGVQRFPRPSDLFQTRLVQRAKVDLFVQRPDLI